MKKFKGLGKVVVITLMASLLMAGCSKGKGETQSETEPKQTQQATVKIEETQSETVSAETEETEVLPEGKMRSILTGEIIDKTVGEKRPVAVMINNINEAIKQQAGTSAADVLYEAVVEGNITRMLGIFQDTSTIEKVGSVRSARHYYIDFANNFDAIYCHYGWSIYAEDRIKNEGIKTVNQNVGSAYFQDNNYAAPHHIFASGDTLEAGIAAVGADRNLPEGYESCFKFNANDTDLEYGTIANKVEIPFVYSKPVLEYDSATKLYKKFQYDAPHTDANNGEQLTFKNILIQFTKYEDIEGGSGCQELTLDGEGKAIYVTNGKAVNVTWKRANAGEQTKYYYDDGTQVKMNVGKTYIAVVPTNFDITLSE